MLHNWGRLTAYNRKTSFLAICSQSHIIAAWACASVAADEVLAHANATILALAIVLLATMLFAIIAHLDYVAIFAITSVCRCGTDEINASSLRAASMPLAVVHIFAHHVWRWMTEESIGLARNLVGVRRIEFSTDSETHCTLVYRVVAEDNRCVLGRRSAFRDWKCTVWTTILAVIVVATTIPTCTVIVVIWVSNTNAIMQVIVAFCAWTFIGVRGHYNLPGSFWSTST
jgi:hypothetical protein